MSHGKIVCPYCGVIIAQCGCMDHGGTFESRVCERCQGRGRAAGATAADQAWEEFLTARRLLFSSTMDPQGVWEAAWMAALQAARDRLQDALNHWPPGYADYRTMERCQTLINVLRTL